MKLDREPVPFEKPQPTTEVPEGYEWVWQNNALYQKDTHFRLDESGWLINPRTKGYHDAYTGWRYDAANECLVDDETGKQYTMDREEIVFVAGVRCYPGPGRSLRGARANLTWNAESRLCDARRTSPTCTTRTAAG